MSSLARTRDRLASLWRAVRPERAREASERFVDAAMRRYLDAHPGDAYAARSHAVDVSRLARTLDWLRELDPKVAGLRILELGGYGIASYVLDQALPGNQFLHVASDLRQTLPVADGSVDLVLAMEVIEHVADLDYAHATVLSGVSHCLAEVHRVLRRGGAMFLTTPNACSLLVIDRALHHEPPWQYPFHFREFTPQEIQILVEEAGLHVQRFATEYVWTDPRRATALRAFLRARRLDVDARGDDMFLVARKTDIAPQPRGRLALPR